MSQTILLNLSSSVKFSVIEDGWNSISRSNVALAEPSSNVSPTLIDDIPKITSSYLPEINSIAILNFEFS